MKYYHTERLFDAKMARNVHNGNLGKANQNIRDRARQKRYAEFERGN